MPDACARCAAALGRSCCQVADGEHLATLTWSDVERIEAAGQGLRAQFVAQEALDEAQAAEYEARRPLYRGYFETGEAQRLTLRRRQGACVFFSAQGGCRLDEATRPTACLLYPFDVDAEGRVSLQVDRFPTLDEARAAPGGGCLAVQEAEGWESLREILGMRETSLQVWIRRLREEVRAHRR